MDSLFCDAQGRPEGQRTRADGLSGGEAWSITRDVAGRVLSEAGVTPATYEYDGLGHLEKSEVETEPQLFVDQYFTRDPQGSAIGEQDFEDPFEFGELDPPGTRWSHTPAGGGRRSGSEEVWDYKGLDEPQGWNPGHVAYTYDDAGNAVDVYDSRYTHTSQTGWDDAEINTHYRSYSKSYYDAEGRLRVHQINRDSLHYEDLQVDSGPPWGAYEEYWYDALGRRVLKRSRQETPICTGWDTSEQRCYSSIERYVWDGDQILWELRQANDGDAKDPTGLPLSGQTGHIGYVYAGGIDMPRGMIRNDASIVLHRNWKGPDHVRNGHRRRADDVCAGHLCQRELHADRLVPRSSLGADAGLRGRARSAGVVRLRDHGPSGPERAPLSAQPLPRPERRAVHAAGPDRDRGGSQPLWVRWWGSDQLQRSVRAVSAGGRQLGGLRPGNIGVVCLAACDRSG